ncbi:hypothetical protein IWX49DRAFT_7345 [Phyllosticta citricarpa]|uniref:Transmembrane protein n=2 Tax=Phyllosticta TaxID=121621 RepID=A0ABR1MQI7_9PEZI
MSILGCKRTQRHVMFKALALLFLLGEIILNFCKRHAYLWVILHKTKSRFLESVRSSSTWTFATSNSSIARPLGAYLSHLSRHTERLIRRNEQKQQVSVWASGTRKQPPVALELHQFLYEGYLGFVFIFILSGLCCHFFVRVDFRI